MESPKCSNYLTLCACSFPGEFFKDVWKVFLTHSNAGISDHYFEKCVPLLGMMNFRYIYCDITSSGVYLMELFTILSRISLTFVLSQNTYGCSAFSVHIY